jgi:hypothetical protein
LLSNAACTCYTAGAVVVDDAFNADWPGVMTGLFQWYSAARATRGGASTGDSTAGETSAEAGNSTAAELVPFAIGFNKVVMCRPDMHAAYFAHLTGGGGGGNGGVNQGDTEQSAESVDASGTAAAAASPRVRKTAWFMGHEVAVFSHGWIATFHGNE